MERMLNIHYLIVTTFTIKYGYCSDFNIFYIYYKQAFTMQHTSTVYAIIMLSICVCYLPNDQCQNSLRYCRTFLLVVW